MSDRERDRPLPSPPPPLAFVVGRKGLLIERRQQRGLAFGPFEALPGGGWRDTCYDFPRIPMTTPRYLIAFTGKKHHGKSTAAAHLCDQHHFVEYAFAEPIKQTCMLLFGLTREQVTDPVLKETVDPRYGLTPRVILQKVGSEVGDCIKDQLGMKERVWMTAFRAWFFQQPPAQSVVVSDCRFLFEEKALLELGFTIVRVTRSSVPSTSTHSSETEMDKINPAFTINNEQDIPHLQTLTDELLRTIRGGK